MNRDQISYSPFANPPSAALYFCLYLVTSFNQASKQARKFGGKVMFLHLSVRCMMSVPVWLPGPMIIPGALCQEGHLCQEGGSLSGGGSLSEGGLYQEGGLCEQGVSVKGNRDRR